MEFEDFISYMKPFFDTLSNISEKVDKLIIQTTITNGRVNSLEKLREEEEKKKAIKAALMWRTILIVFTGVVTVVGSLACVWIYNHYKK